MNQRTRNILSLVLIVLIAAVLLRGSGASIPGILPEPDSPFPNEGRWLLVASESSNLGATRSAANAQSVREFFGPNRRVLDYDQEPTGEPWIGALEWVEGKSNGKPYYVSRHGNKVSEGFLEGSGAKQLATLTAAMGEIE